MGNATLEQADFGGGIYRGRRAPQGSVYDALNALISDEGDLFKRGGSAFLSTSNTADTLLGLADVNLAPGSRTLAWGAAHLYVLDGSNAPVDLGVSAIAGNNILYPFARAASVAPYAVFQQPSSDPTANPGWLLFYAGSLKATYNTGTVALTNGSRTMTGTGTSWLTGADAGMFLGGTGADGLVDRVASNTSIVLRDPYAGSTASGIPYTLSPVKTLSVTTVPGITGQAFMTAVGATPRLVLGWQNRVYFSALGNPLSFTVATDFLQIPQGNAYITGMDALGDAAIVFTTAGIYAIENLELSLVDDFGNIQIREDRINADVLLWADQGIAAWDGALVVPAIDDVYIVTLGGQPRPITGDSGDEKIRPLYRSYVKAGYTLGRSAVHRGHYLLPIVNGTTLVDVLVCRLDRGAAWTRWSGHAASVAYAVRAAGSGSRAPLLFAATGPRVSNLTDALDGPSTHSTDADGTVPTFTVDTNDFDTGPGMRPHTVEKLRAIYEMATTGTVTTYYAAGLEGAAFTGLDYAAEVLADSPAGYWPLDETSGTSAADHAGANGGTYVNSPTLDHAPLVGGSGSSVAFTAASSEELTLPGNSLSTNGTISLWFQWTAGTALLRDASSSGGWAALDSGGTFTVRVAGTDTATSKTTAQVRDGGTHHLAIVKSAGSLTVYLDGVVIASATGLANTASANPWHIARNGSNAQYSDCVVDEVSINSTALTADRVLARYAAGLRTGAGLEGGGVGGGVSDGLTYSWWPVAKARERIRFRFRQAGACSSMILRRLELTIRQRA